MKKLPPRKFTITKVTFREDEIARALKLTPVMVHEEFSDGRVASRFSEHWGAMLYGYVKHADTNAKYSDGDVAVGNLPSAKISVKSLTRSGVKFQLSKDTGSGRTCSQEDLVSALLEAYVVVVVDITQFPTVTFIPLESKDLLKWARKPCTTRDRARGANCSLTPSGLSREKLFELLQGDYPGGIIEEDGDARLAIVLKTTGERADVRAAG